MLLKASLMIIIGALIGWITNYFAIKMLFRPLKEINILGFKVQGLIPKRKMEMAESIADTIQEELHDALGTPLGVAVGTFCATLMLCSGLFLLWVGLSALGVFSWVILFSVLAGAATFVQWDTCIVIRRPVIRVYVDINPTPQGAF